MKTNYTILFRGIPKNTEHFSQFKDIWSDHCDDTFVFGSFVYDSKNDKYFIAVKIQSDSIIPRCVNNGSISMIEVIPETIGQYTNFDNSEDCPVFTNDVVYTRTRYGMDYGVIVFKEGRFCVEWNSEKHFPDKAKLLVHYDLNPQIKVIGNLYKEKDLLE